MPRSFEVALFVAKLFRSVPGLAFHWSQVERLLLTRYASQ